MNDGMRTTPLPEPSSLIASRGVDLYAAELWVIQSESHIGGGLAYWGPFDSEERAWEMARSCAFAAVVYVPIGQESSSLEDKGYSEETCMRCGWLMGQPAMNCQNDDTPHVFPSQVKGMTSGCEPRHVLSLRR